MLKYTLGAAFLLGWLVLAVVYPGMLAESRQGLSPNSESRTIADRVSPGLRRVKGELFFTTIPAWGGQDLTLTMDMRELDPVEHMAAGAISWNTTGDVGEADPSSAQYVEAVVTHLFFGADEPVGDPDGVVIVAQILAAPDGATGKRGDYAYFWLRDGGPDRADQWGVYPYSVEPRADFFPYDRSPAALGYFDVHAMQITDPWFPLVAAAGDVVLEEVVVR